MSKYKILFLLSSPSIGGTETFIISLVPELKTIGVEVDILNTWRNSHMREPAIRSNLNYLELNGTSRHIHFKDLGFIVSHIKSEKYDAVVVFGIRINLWIRILKPFFKTPLIVGLRGLDQWRKWYHVLPDRLTESACDIFVPNSQAVAECRMKRERTSPDKILVIENGIDTGYFAKTGQHGSTTQFPGLPNNKVIIATVANFRMQKGHDFLVDVISHFRSSFEQAHFVWAGEGPLRQSLEDKIKRIGVSDQITFLGRLEDVRPLLERSDIFVLPSREEGMPRGLMEAMAMGLPSVATDVGGTGEVVEPGISGFLANYGDIETFGNYLKRLIESPSLRKEMGGNSRQRVLNKFGLHTVAKKYAVLFETIAQRTLTRAKIREAVNNVI
jgi:glycosyltransferase involved in cell wall biosynthesis